MRRHSLLGDEQLVARVLEPADALGGVEASFRLIADSEAVKEPRHRTHPAGETLNVMVFSPWLGALAVKTYPVTDPPPARRRPFC